MSDTDDFASLEKSGWTDRATAESYAGAFSFVTEQCVPTLVSAVQAGPGKHVLDLCCGHGVVAEGLVAAGAEVTGLDFSAAMLGMARARVPTASFVEGDAMDLPFAPESFDAVTCGLGILHVPDPERVLAQIRRVLRPGGRLAYTVWHAPTIPSAIGYLFAALGAHGDPSIVLPPGPGMHDYADPDYATPRLEVAGFGAIEMQVIDSYWLVDTPDAPVDYFRDGTVRGAGLLRAQPPENMARIRASVTEQVTAAHGSALPIRIPIPAMAVKAVAA